MSRPRPQPQAQPRRGPVILTVILAALLLAVLAVTLTVAGNWAPSPDDGGPTGGADQSTPAAASLATDGDRKRRAAQITSTFENATTDLQYAAAENIGDGRGITAGRAGFTSAIQRGLDAP